MTLNPYDVFPRRNLPAEAEEWGREVEERLVGLTHGSIAQSTGLQSENRTAAATAGELARQLDELERQAEQLEAVYRAIPKTTQVVSAANGFGLTGGWNTVHQQSITVPDGANRIDLLVTGSGQLVSASTTQNITSSHRLVVPQAHASPAFAGAYWPDGVFRTVMAPSYGWSFAVTPGQTIDVQFQVSATDASAYPYRGDCFAVLSTLATFTG